MLQKHYTSVKHDTEGGKHVIHTTMEKNQSQQTRLRKEMGKRADHDDTREGVLWSIGTDAAAVADHGTAGHCALDL